MKQVGFFTSKKSILGVFVFSVMMGGFLALSHQNLTQLHNSSSFKNPGTQKAEASPSPFPFQELTIPFLRAQSYSAELEPLELISENDRYRSYLTSYHSDGFEINGLLTVPMGIEPEGGWPAVVFVHGYIPPDTYKTQEKYVAYVDYLARNNFVVFKIDLRGHGESEGEPSGAYYAVDYVSDTLAAYSALQNTDFINPNRIGLWGHSMAGNVLIRAVAAQPETPAVVVWGGAVFTYSDFVEYGINDQSYQRPNENSARTQKRQQLFNLYGEFDPTSEFWRQVVATNYLDDFQGAIQLHHAANDNVVDVRYSRNLNQILDQTTIPHEFHEYAQGGHNLEGAAFNTAMERTVRFYEEYLK